MEGLADGIGVAGAHDMMRGGMTDFCIGLDLGGTNLRAAVIDKSGKMLDKVSGTTKFREGREAVLDEIVTAIATLRDRHGPAGFRGIGVGVPGFIRIKEGYLTNSNNLPYLENFPVRDEIGRRLGTRVILENDAKAAALGEKWMGAGRDVDDLVLLTLGTGIGGGIISGGRIIRGYVGMAGELGHCTVVPNGNPCGCGNQGCLEKHASATAVTAMARLMQLGENLSSKDVCELARQAGEAGDKAREIWRVVGEALGIALATLVNTFNFPLYLLSGGMLPAWEFFAPHMLRTVEQRSFTYRVNKSGTRIAQATLGNEAGLYGAAYLPWLEE
jgi:glucokinase